jgi:hypothetical protein
MWHFISCVQFEYLILAIAIDRPGSIANEFPMTMITNVTVDNIPIQLVSPDITETREHFNISWCMNTMFKRPLTIRECILLLIIVLTLLSLLLTNIFPKNQRKKTTIFEGRWSFISYSVEFKTKKWSCRWDSIGSKNRNLADRNPTNLKQNSNEIIQIDRIWSNVNLFG